jgi:ATP adenylyltransferase
VVHQRHLYSFHTLVYYQVTDVFREQSDPLNGNDLAALATLVLELPGVGFFNSGSNAGASQRHRHLQVG